MVTYVLGWPTNNLRGQSPLERGELQGLLSLWQTLIENSTVQQYKESFAIFFMLNFCHFFAILLVGKTPSHEKIIYSKAKSPGRCHFRGISAVLYVRVHAGNGQPLRLCRVTCCRATCKCSMPTHLPGQQRATKKSVPRLAPPSLRKDVRGKAQNTTDGTI